LRDKFLKNGLEKLTDEEVVELLLSFGTPRRDCKQAARDLMKKFGSIRGVFEASTEALSEIAGVGPNNIVAIKFIHAVSGKFLEQRLTGKVYLNSSEQVNQYLRHDLENQAKEIFKVIYLDSNNAIIKIEDLSRGSISSTHVDSRELLERAIHLKSAALVFVHNHPSGNIRPSDKDAQMTRRLVHAAFLFGIIILDHIIIGKGGEYFSFKDSKGLALFEREMRDTYSMPPRPSGTLLHDSNPFEDYAPVKIKLKRPKRKGNTSAPAVEGLNLPTAGPEAVMAAESKPEYKKNSGGRRKRPAKKSGN